MWNSLLRVMPSWALKVPKDGDSHLCLGHCSHVGTSSWWESYLYLTRIPLSGIAAFTSNRFAEHLRAESGFSFFYDLHWWSEERNKTTSTSPPDQGMLKNSQSSLCSHVLPPCGPSLDPLQSPVVSCTGQTGDNPPEATSQVWNRERKVERAERRNIKEFNAHILAQVSLIKQLSCTCQFKLLFLSSQCHHLFFLPRAFRAKEKFGWTLSKVPGKRTVFSESRISLYNWHWGVGGNSFHAMKAIHLIKTLILEWIF